MLTVLLTVFSGAIFTGILVTVAYWVIWQPLLQDLARARKAAAAAADLVTELTVALNTSNASRAEFERQAKKAVADELAQARFQAQDWERRANEYRDTIAGVLEERNSWNRLYDEQSIAHGNAQAVMMDAIGHLERKLKEAGRSVILPPIIRE